MDGKELLFKLSNLNAVSGSEYLLKNTLSDAFKDYVDDIDEGNLGDFIAHKKGSSDGKFKIMIAAHADEVGLLVTGIDERGFIHFNEVAGIDPKTLPAQEVIIHGKRDVYGVIGAKPPHVLSSDDMKKAVKIEDMVIDTGLDKDEVLKLITIGDFITIKREAKNLLGNFMTGKALDDRSGIAILYECARELQKMNHYADVYFVSSVMEETGCGGVSTSTYKINPQIGIAVDVTFGDTYLDDDDVDGDCGKGIPIYVGPNLHPKLTEKLIEVAKENNIPHSISVSPGATGTDAWEMQIQREGVPTLLISLPLKYMHTSTEVIDYRDVKTAGKLLAQFISEIKDGDSYEL